MPCLSFNFVKNMTLNKKYSIFLKINAYYHTKNVQQLFTKYLKTLRAQVVNATFSPGSSFKYCFFGGRGEQAKFAKKIAEELREGLPISGTEREIIEYYFHRGFQYRRIVFFLEKYHIIRLSERLLTKILKTWQEIS